jgi:DNA-binding PadR family transcriptional regulator
LTPHDDIARFVALREAARSGAFGGGRGRGRRRRGDVRAALLLLLAEDARNGYQLMQAIEERSRGHWRASPGSVYPTLQQLEDEGLIRPIEVDGTKLFELTDAGREHVTGRQHEPPWQTGEETQTIDDMKEQLKQVHIAAAQVLRAGDDEQVRRAAKALADARRTMYRILADDDDA